MLDQTLIAGHVGENAQLDLGVVGIQEQETIPRDKDLPDLHVRNIPVFPQSPL